MPRFSLFKHKKKALVADDDAGTLQLFTFLLKEEGWDVVEARTGEEVVSKALAESPSVLLLDNRMPGYSGAEAYEVLRSSGVDIPAILISGVDDLNSIALSSGIRRFFQKPVDVSRLLDAMDEAVKEGR